MSITLVCCSNYSVVESGKEKLLGPRPGEPAWEVKSQTHEDLISLPKPKGKIIASTYGFRDQTGQYKPQPSNSFSTAVSQGANAILIKALKDSGWFIPIEREGLQNLLTERKIIRAGLKKTMRDIPPLVGASVMLEGGIIGYDTNIKTGGAGVKYFGIGPSERYLVDQVTVSIRAVDIYSGKIINTVVVSKTIVSQEVSAGVFRFVKFKRLLEMEAGYTRNEPVQLALVDAIETAVIRLIVSGLNNNLWALAQPRDMSDRIIREYTDFSDQNARMKARELATERMRQGAQAVGGGPIVLEAKPFTAKQHVGGTYTRAKHPEHVVKAKKVAVAPASRRGKLNKRTKLSTPVVAMAKSMPDAAKNQAVTMNLSGAKPPASLGKASSPVAVSKLAKVTKNTKKEINRSKSSPVRSPDIILNDQAEISDIDIYNVSYLNRRVGGYYAIQLMSSQKVMDLVEFMSNQDINRNDIRYISYEVKGDDRYGLLYGTFEDKHNAIKAIQSLPEKLKIHRPWVRSVGEQGNL